MLCIFALYEQRTANILGFDADDDVNDDAA